MLNRREIADAAWLEFIIAQAYATGSPPGHEVRSRRGPRPPWATRSQPPGWFVREELGYDVMCGPSLEWTCRTLRVNNQQSMKVLGADAPRKVTWPR